jgi:hypothetical protein
MANSARLKVSTDFNVRVLYIHDVSKIIKPNDKPVEIFTIELLACFCLEKDEPFRKDIKKSKPEDLRSLVREHIITNMIVLVSVWDNVNVCYDNDNGKLIYNQADPPPANYHVKGLTACCNEIVLCVASFNNSPSGDSNFSDPRTWTQLTMKSVGDKELGNYIQSLDPFFNLFQQLSTADKNAVLVHIEHLTSNLPLELSKINDFIKKTPETSKPPMEVFRKSIEDYKKDATSTIRREHTTKFQTTLGRNPAKEENFFK